MVYLIFKLRIVVFVLITAGLGYALGFPVEKKFSSLHLCLFLFGLFSLSSGSFALNQVQEWRLDQKMSRTQNRPIASGHLSVKQGLMIASVLLATGLLVLFFLEPLCAGLGAMTVILYNGFYTKLWKMRSAFAAVPGAIPGAMPGVIGYTAIAPNLFTTEAVYLFLLMFLWQMPHFWSLAIRYCHDYEKGGVPVLPLAIGKEGTLYHSGLYTFVYAGLALASPYFVSAGIFYLVLVLPFSMKVLWEFFRFYKSKNDGAWLKFFLWINLSLLVFLVACVLDKWSPFLKGDVNFI